MDIGRTFGPGVYQFKHEIEVLNRPVNSLEIHDIELSIGIEENEYKVILGKLIYSPVPQVKISSKEISPDNTIHLDLSPAKEYTVELDIILENECILNIEGIRFRKLRGKDPFEVAGVWFDAIVVEESIVRIQGRGTHSVNFNFSDSVSIGSSMEETDTPFVPELKTEIDPEIGREELLDPSQPNFVFNILYIPGIELGILASTSSGFCYFVHNRARAEYSQTGIKDDTMFPILGLEPFVDEAGPEKERHLLMHSDERLRYLADHILEIYIPKGIKRRRFFSLYVNYKREPGKKYDETDNWCKISLVLHQEFDEYKTILSKSIWYSGLDSRERATFDGSLSIGNQKKTSGFQITFDLPEDFESDKIVFNLHISRYSPLTGNSYDECKPYKIIARLYEPELNEQPISIDFGTSNTCVAGPIIIGGNLSDKAICYELNYFCFDPAASPRIFPTVLAYMDVGGEIIPYLPGPYDQNNKKCYRHFKINLPKEFALIKDMPRKEKSAFTLTVDFIYCILERLELYLEDRHCTKTILSNVEAAAPVGFIPEIRKKIESLTLAGLKEHYGKYSPDSGSFRMDNDEPFAVLTYSLMNSQIPDINNQDLPEMVCVFDIGGGTTDSALILMDADPAMLLSTGGSIAVGGNTFDAWITRRIQHPVSWEYSVEAQNLEMSNNREEISSYLKQEILNTEHYSLYLKIMKIKENIGIKLGPDGIKELPDEYIREYDRVFFNELSKCCMQSDNSNLAQIIVPLIQEGIEKYYFHELSKPDIENWSRPSFIFGHLLLPFFHSLTRKLQDIFSDTLKQAYGNLPSHIKGKEVSFTLLMAGNGSKLNYLETLMRMLMARCFEDVCKTFPDFPKLKIGDVKIIDKPKESVALGVNILARSAPIEIEKRNDPPFDLYYIVVDRLYRNNKLVTIKYPLPAIPIFSLGEKCRGEMKRKKILPKLFRTKDLPRRRNPNEWIPLTRKIGIDLDLSYRYKITPLSTMSRADDSETKYLLFILEPSNNPMVYGFNTEKELFEADEIKKLIQIDPELAKDLRKLLQSFNESPV